MARRVFARLSGVVALVALFCLEVVDCRVIGVLRSLETVHIRRRGEFIDKVETEGARFSFVS